MTNTTGTDLINPFVGLRAFEETEDYLFFGRSNQIGELLKILGESRFLAVIGSSGSGKSSLVKSGLLPAIYSGFMTVGSNWRVATMRPGGDPIGFLSRALASEGTLYTDINESDIPYESIIQSSLRRSENGLIQVYKDAHLPVNENLLVVVDQFEELFRFSRFEKEKKLGKSDAIHFIQILLAAVQQKEFPIYVLLTMRADFLGDCAEFRGLPEAINEGQYLIPRMRRDEIREAITGPVAVSKATITPRLVTRLLNDINNDTDQLPILQHAMMRTWDAWYQRNEDTPIDFEDYERIGTMKAALSLHADEVYAELRNEREQQICELMFKALTDKAADIRGIRRPRSIADLSILTNALPLEVIDVVEVFRKSGRTFLMPPQGITLTENSIIDISHESLMRIWTRLIAWIEEEGRNGDIFLRLANSADLKEQGLRGLLKNPELEIALRWKEQNKPSAKWAEGYKVDFEKSMDYLEDSRKEDLAEKKILADKDATRKRLVKAIFAMLGLLVVASFILAAHFNSLKEDAYREKAKAELATRIAKKSAADLQLALKSKQLALQQEQLAIQKERLALDSKNYSDSLRRIAEASENRANQKQHEADSSAAVAVQKTAETVKEKQIVVTLLSKTKEQNREIAAYEYARLIREGPSEENKNKEEFYGNDFFLAYNYHFDRLADSIADKARPAYESIKNKLYYNNDLYRRIYEKFLIIKQRDEVIKKEDASKPDFSSRVPGGNNANVNFRKNGTGLLNVININNGNNTLADTLDKKDQEFVSRAMSKKLQLTFCSTNDNFIYAYNNRLERVDVISMGAKVTALDVFDEGNRSIIYFGTASGYIGYIYYDRHKKNQPVFENKLESEITAIRLFKHSVKAGNSNSDGNSFLLAAAMTSSPKVYKLDENSLKPNKFLYGNELPYTAKEFGNITGAEYSPRLSRVILFTTTGTFSWNPFSYELLEKLEEREKFNPSLGKTAALINETKIY